MSAELFKRAKALFGRDVPEPAPAAPRKAPKKFHAVTIAPGPRACPEARALQGQRFLSREAPPLPLKNCGSPHCECHYEHYDDRARATVVRTISVSPSTATRAASTARR
jgi:hypothetical protein